MHNHNGKNDSWMMWIMMVCCLAPILVLLFLGNLKLGGGINWFVIIAIGIFVVSHFWFMRRKKSDIDVLNQDEASDKHRGGHCH